MPNEKVSESLVRLRIKGIALDREADTPVVILQDYGGLRSFPVPVGPFEANAIILMLKKVKTPRMLTHELFAHFLSENKFTITKMVIYGTSGDEYKAKLFYKRGRKNRLLEVRPSDGLALGLHFDTPFYAPENLLVSTPLIALRYNDTGTYTTDGFFIESERSEYPLM